MSFTTTSNTVLDFELTNDGFFPDLNLSTFQKEYRIPAEYEQDMVLEHLRLAILIVNDALFIQRQAWIDQGYLQLVDVPGVDIGGQQALLIYYRRAVFSQAKASLLKAFATMNRKDEGENLAKESDSTEQQLLADVNQALRRMMGVRTNITAVLL